jgi:hypothetical protein
MLTTSALERCQLNKIGRMLNLMSGSKHASEPHASLPHRANYRPTDVASDITSGHNAVREARQRTALPVAKGLGVCVGMVAASASVSHVARHCAYQCGIHIRGYQLQWDVAANTWDRKALQADGSYKGHMCTMDATCQQHKMLVSSCNTSPVGSDRYGLQHSEVQGISTYICSLCPDTSIRMPHSATCLPECQLTKLNMACVAHPAQHHQHTTPAPYDSRVCRLHQHHERNRGAGERYM